MNIPRLTLELHMAHATHFEFFDALYDENDRPYFPFGGTTASRLAGDIWIVRFYSPFGNFGKHKSKLLEHPIFGHVMTQLDAIDLAKRMQP